MENNKDQNLKTVKTDNKKLVKSNYQNLIDQIAKLNLKELKTFVTDLQKYFDIDLSQQFVSGSSANPEAQEKKSEFLNVILTGAGTSKIAVIKTISKLTGKGLLDSKKALDNLPFVVAEKQNEENANKIKNDLLTAGATVELK